MATANIAPCDHRTGLRFDPGTGQCECAKCGQVWLDRAAVQARNAKVARSVMQALGTLIGGTKPSLGK